MNANAVSEDDCRGRRHSAPKRYDPQSCDGPSAPVFDADSARLRLALSVFGRVGRLNVAPDGPVAALMVEAARSLAAELQGQPAINGAR